MSTDTGRGEEKIDPGKYLFNLLGKIKIIINWNFKESLLYILLHIANANVLRYLTSGKIHYNFMDVDWHSL